MSSSTYARAKCRYGVSARRTPRAALGFLKTGPGRQSRPGPRLADPAPQGSTPVRSTIRSAAIRPCRREPKPVTTAPRTNINTLVMRDPGAAASYTMQVPSSSGTGLTLSNSRYFSTVIHPVGKVVADLGAMHHQLPDDSTERLRRHHGYHTHHVPLT